MGARFEVDQGIPEYVEFGLRLNIFWDLFLHCLAAQNALQRGPTHVPAAQNGKGRQQCFLSEGLSITTPCKCEAVPCRILGYTKAVLTHSTHWVLHLVVGHPANQRVQHVETGFRV